MPVVKKLFVLSVMSLVLLAIPGTALAFTLKEHMDGAKKYVQAINKSARVQKTYCGMDGAILSDPSDIAGHDSIRYVRGEKDYAVELRPFGDVIWLVTINPEFKLPDGSAVGDPIENIMKAALIPGDYANETNGGVRNHIWLRDGIATIVTETGGRIGAIFYYNTLKERGVTINKDYAAFLSQGADGEKKQAEDPAPPNNSASAKDITRIRVTGDDVNLRSAPSAKGKVLGTAY
jgi:hypothetical protein